MKPALLLLLLLLLFCVAVQGHSQILKIDKGNLVSDSSGYVTGIVDATFALNNRSSTAEQQNLYLGIVNNLDLVYIAEQSATLLISGLNYYKIGDGPLVYNGTAHVRHIFRRAVILTPEVFGQVQFDESRNMELRYLLGGGMRWNILQRKNKLYTGLGAFNEFERWNGEGKVIRKRLWKLNYYLSGDVQLTPTTNINSIVYFQSGFDSSIDAFRNRVSGHIEFKNALTSHFKVKLTSNFLLDDRPIIELNQWIYEVFFGFEYRFK